MNTVKTLLLALCLAFAIPSFANTINGEAVETFDWEQLMPSDFTLDSLFTEQEVQQFASLNDLDPEAEALMDKLNAALSSAPVVDGVDGKMIKIPGFVVPLEGEGQKLTSFFLVPYFGACIHTPPPPSNQIIHVHYEPGVTLESLYDAVWISGKLTIADFSHDLASSGYSMEAFRIEPYDFAAEEAQQ